MSDHWGSDCCALFFLTVLYSAISPIGVNGAAVCMFAQTLPDCTRAVRKNGGGGASFLVILGLPAMTFITYSDCRKPLLV